MPIRDWNIFDKDKKQYYVVCLLSAYKGLKLADNIESTLALPRLLSAYKGLKPGEGEKTFQTLLAFIKRL